MHVIWHATLADNLTGKSKRTAAERATEEISKCYPRRAPKGGAKADAVANFFPNPSTSGRAAKVSAGNPASDDSSDSEADASYVSVGDQDIFADIMVDYDIEDAADAKDTQTEARGIKCDFDRKDIKSWLQQLEIRMEFAGIKS